MKDWLMKDWFLPSLGTILCWGCWAFLPKISVQYIDVKSSVIYQSLGGMLAALLIFLTLSNPVETNLSAAMLAIFTGMLNVLGILLYIYAITKGPVSIIATLSALYPCITIMLALIILHETLALKQIVAMLLALASIVLISM